MVKYENGYNKTSKPSDIGHVRPNAAANASAQTSIFDFIEDTDAPNDDTPDTDTGIDMGINADFIALLHTYGIPEHAARQALRHYQVRPHAAAGGIRRDNALMHAVLAPLLHMQYRKEGTYGDSWAKRGEIGVFFNISRKFDRLEHIVLNGARDEVGESDIDTVADLANYALLWLTYIARERPDQFKDWLAHTHKEDQQ